MPAWIYPVWITEVPYKPLNNLSLHEKTSRNSIYIFGHKNIYCIFKTWYIISVLSSTDCCSFYNFIFFCSSNMFFVNNAQKLKYQPVHCQVKGNCLLRPPHELLTLFHVVILWMTLKVLICEGCFRLGSSKQLPPQFCGIPKKELSFLMVTDDISGSHKGGMWSCVVSLSGTNVLEEQKGKQFRKFQQPNSLLFSLCYCLKDFSYGMTQYKNYC
jgi:hypothetical protein